MRSRPSPDHQAAVSRRLAQLGAELTASRLLPDDPLDPGPPPDEGWWAGHTRVATVARAGRLGDPDTPIRGPSPGSESVPETAETVPGTVPEGWVVPAVPIPGRHAARRRARPAVLGLVPEPLRGRAGLGPGPVAVVAVLVALGLAVTCWWVVRADPGEPVGRLAAAESGPLATPAGAATPGPSGSPAGAAAAGAAGGPDPAAAPVTVDVAGKVRRPGIAVLPAGSRVVDALEAAGGARPGVGLTGLNLARLLVDGEQVLVGRTAPPAGGVATVGPSAGAGGAPGSPVNLNLASQAELELLPDVGPVTALAIISWREEHGGFRVVEELLEVDGIGEVTLAKLTPHVTV